MCDWFGVNQIICSKDTVDCFNPKVIQASMGSLAKVEVFYKNLPIFFKNYHLKPIATDTQGKNIYKTEFQSNKVFVFGNEGNGISDDLKVLLNQYIKIPSFGKPAADSLNVAVAAGIILGEIKRRG